MVKQDNVVILVAAPRPRPREGLMSQPHDTQVKSPSLRMFPHSSHRLRSHGTAYDPSLFYDVPWLMDQSAFHDILWYSMRIGDLVYIVVGSEEMILTLPPVL